MRLWISCLAAFVIFAGTAQAQQVRQMLNGIRAEQGLGPLAPSARLEEAAMAHALDMAQNGFFDHEGSDGSDVGARLDRTGYGWCAVAENIAKGPDTPVEAMGLWVQSPPHRRNMLHADVTEYGLVRAPGNIWVLVLARDGCAR